MLSSIRIQLITVLLALIALILAQGFIARENQEVLNKGISSASKAVVDVGLVKELERDVVDLQRNVLIFKENASKSAITRFSRLMVTINTKLDKLALVDEGSEEQDDSYILTRMKEHLNAYQENFTQVVDARSQRDNLLARGTLSDITLLEKILSDARASGDISSESEEQAKTLLIRAENAMLKYLMKPDMSFIRTFNEAADTLRNLTLTRNTALQEKIERLSEKSWSTS